MPRQSSKRSPAAPPPLASPEAPPEAPHATSCCCPCHKPRPARPEPSWSTTNMHTGEAATVQAPSAYWARQRAAMKLGCDPTSVNVQEQPASAG